MQFTVIYQFPTLTDIVAFLADTVITSGYVNKLLSILNIIDFELEFARRESSRLKSSENFLLELLIVELQRKLPES